MVGTTQDQFPDIWGIGRNRLDLQVGYNFSNRLELKVVAEDVINEPVRIAQLYDGRTRYNQAAGDILMRDVRMGRLFTLSLNLTL